MKMNRQDFVAAVERSIYPEMDAGEAAAVRALAQTVTRVRRVYMDGPGCPMQQIGAYLACGVALTDSAFRFAVRFDDATRHLGDYDIEVTDEAL